MNEFWKRYRDTEYYASNLGRIFSNYKKKRFKCGIMKPWRDGHGYVSVSINGKKTKLHTIIAECFISKRPTSIHQVNHKNFITDDNRVENLEWVTPKQNIRHLVSLKGSSNQFSKKKKVAMYSLEGLLLEKFDSALEASKKLSIKLKNGKNNSRTINDVCRGKQKTSNGYIWRYFEDFCDEKITLEKSNNPLMQKVKLTRISDGEELFFDSVSEASRSISVCRKQLSACIHGKQKTAHGYLVNKI